MIKAYEDTSAMIGASCAVRAGTMESEEMSKTMLAIVKEWNDRGMLLYFLSCVFNQAANLHASVAHYEGMSPEELLKSKYLTIFGE